MAGQPDPVKRANVRRYLLTKEGQQESDNEVAKQTGCSRILVSSVRRELIASGEHPKETMRPVSLGENILTKRVYLPGQSARGGYVFSVDGKVIRESEWRRIVEESPKLQTMCVRGEAVPPVGWVPVKAGRTTKKGKDRAKG